MYQFIIRKPVSKGRRGQRASIGRDGKFLAGGMTLIPHRLKQLWRKPSDLVDLFPAFPIWVGIKDDGDSITIAPPPPGGPPPLGGGGTKKKKKNGAFHVDVANSECGRNKDSGAQASGSHIGDPRSASAGTIVFCRKQ